MTTGTPFQSADQRITETSIDNTTGLGKKGVDFTASIRVRMLNCEDTGWDVIEYIRDEGYEFGSTYNVGNTVQNDVHLYQHDPPQKVEGSDYLWDVIVHYDLNHRKSRNAQDGGAKDKTELFPTLEISTVARQVPVERAFYRGGRNGPGNSTKATITSGSEGVTGELVSGDPGDGSFSPCVGLRIINDEWGDLKAFPVGHDLNPPVMNSANDPVDPPPTKQETNGILTISRNVRRAFVTAQTFPIDWINQKAMVIFSRTLQIPILPYTMRQIRWRMTELYDKQSGEEYVKIIGEFELQPRGWRLESYDRGYRRKLRVAFTDLLNVIQICDTKQVFTTQSFTNPATGVTEQVTRGNDWDFLFQGDINDTQVCFEYENITDKKGNTLKQISDMNGHGQEMGYLTWEERAYAPGIGGNVFNPEEPPECRLMLKKEPPVSIWSIYDELDCIPLPFFRDIIRPL